MRSLAAKRPLECWFSIAFCPPPSQICSSSLRMPETRSARKRMLASKRADVGSTRVVRIEVSEAMFRDCYVKPAGQKGANLLDDRCGDTTDAALARVPHFSRSLREVGSR